MAEILPTVRLERAAGSPKMLAGFMNLRGDPLAVVRLAVLFGGDEEPGEDLYHHVLQLRLGPGAPLLGLLVERVTDVDAAADRLAPLDEAQSLNGAVVANLALGERLVPLLDAERLLLLEERRRIDELSEAVRTRLSELGDVRA